MKPCESLNSTVWFMCGCVFVRVCVCVFVCCCHSYFGIIIIETVLFMGISH